MLNAASYAPYTTGISPGEQLVLYGSNLASNGTTEVTINGVQVPATAQSNSVVIATVPPLSSSFQLSNTNSSPSTLSANPAAPVYAQIQAISAGQPSNIIWAFVNQTTPGIFTAAQNGVNDAFAMHANGTPVTTAAPAVPGESITIFSDGLGMFNPPGGTTGNIIANPALSQITVLIGGKSATVTSIQLPVATSGTYVLTITVPRSLTVTAATEEALVIEQVDATNMQTAIAIGPAPASTGGGSGGN